MKTNFASDNNSGIAPEYLAAIAEANIEHAPAYGNDDWTKQACARFREFFETDCEVFFVFNGTSSNSLALAHLCNSYHSVICHPLAHIETDECGAPEFFSGGSKILLADGPGGKISPAEMEKRVHQRRDIHYPKPHVLSVTQATEVGTLYSIDELLELGALAHGLGLKIHMDGARLSNAIATLDCTPKEATWKVGVDVLCFGGTKNGMLGSEAVVFFNKQLAHDFDYRCKQAGQLASKMRFHAAQWIASLRDGLWLQYAKQANHTAAFLATKLRAIPGVRFMHQPQANSLFITLPADTIAKLHARGWSFYEFIGTGGARLMCSWDTQENDCTAFAEDVRNLLAASPGIRA